MRSRARERAPLLLLCGCCVAAAAACSPSTPLPRLGEHADHGVRAPQPPTPTVGSARAEPPPHPFALTEVLPRLHKATERLPSEHLDGTLDGEVLVNDAASGYPRLGPGRTLGVGATLVERHALRGTDPALVYFVMVRRPAGYDEAGGDWEYLVVSATGEIEQRGHLSLCARCHVDAPRDHLFGPTR